MHYSALNEVYRQYPVTKPIRENFENIKSEKCLYCKRNESKLDVLLLIVLILFILGLSK